MFNRRFNVETENTNVRRIYKAALQLFAEKGGEKLTVNELAQKAGVARGTIYNNFKNLDSLFEDLASALAKDMSDWVLGHLEGIEDPPERLALAIKLYMKRAHDDPDWARFLIRFGISNASLQNLLSGPMVKDLKRGISKKKYQIKEDQLKAVAVAIGCSVLGGFSLIREGQMSWKLASEAMIGLILTSIGVPPKTTQKIISKEVVVHSYQEID